MSSVGVHARRPYCCSHPVRTGFFVPQPYDDELKTEGRCSSSANRILRSRQKKLLTKSPTLQKYFLYMYLFRLFPSGGEKNELRRILHGPVEGTPSMSVENFDKKDENLTCLCLTLSRIYRKTGFSTKTKSCEGNNVRNLDHFYPQKSKCPRRF